MELWPTSQGGIGCQRGQERHQARRDGLEFPITNMKYGEWEGITRINVYLGEMPEAELRKVLRLLSLKACFGGTAQQAK